MSRWFIRLSLLAIPLVLCSLLPQTAQAAGNYYVNADSAAKDDNNSCRSESAPCATFSGAITNILTSSDPANSTILANGTFTEQITISDQELEGLTINWLNKGSRPIIDATGNTYGIYVSSVDKVTVNHVEVLGAENYAIFFGGGVTNHIQGGKLKNSHIHDMSSETTSHWGVYFNYIDDAVVRDNVLYNLGSTNINLDAFPDATGIYFFGTDRGLILNNSIRDFLVSTTFTEENSYTYSFASGIYVYEGDDMQISGNSIKDIETVSTNEYDGYSYAYTYPIYLYNSVGTTVKHNTIRRSDATAIATQDGKYATPYVYAIYALIVDELIIHHNQVLGGRALSQVEDEEYNAPVMYGIDVEGIGSATLTKNTVKNLHAESANGTGSAVTIGIRVSDTQQALIKNNTVKQVDAAADAEGDATTRAIQLSDAPKTDIVRNRLADFSASVGTEEETTASTGIELGYNSSADILNNLMYFTQAVSQDSIHAIAILSTQADPIRILHNTLSNVRTCLLVSYAGQIDFQNNLCLLGTSGSYGTSVNTDNFDITQLTSDFNLFYNLVEPVLMNDDATGSMTFAEWKSGDYNQDTHSLKKNPDLKRNNPNSKKYLHLKKTSPAVNEGSVKPDFGQDQVMNEFLTRDWDKDIRPQGKRPDMGADEFTV